MISCTETRAEVRSTANLFAGWTLVIVILQLYEYNNSPKCHMLSNKNWQETRCQPRHIPSHFSNCSWLNGRHWWNNQEWIDLSLKGSILHISTTEKWITLRLTLSACVGTVLLGSELNNNELTNGDLAQSSIPVKSRSGLVGHSRQSP